jgi:hypothetical protein
MIDFFEDNVLYSVSLDEYSCVCSLTHVDEEQLLFPPCQQDASNSKEIDLFVDLANLEVKKCDIESNILDHYRIDEKDLQIDGDTLAFNILGMEGDSHLISICKSV